MTALHKSLTGTDIHVPISFTYADAAARVAATGFVAADLHKFAIQTDDYSIWVLVSTTPTWVSLAGTSVPDPHAASHESGGSDEIDVTGLFGTLADPQTPDLHAGSHTDGGSDEIATATPTSGGIPKADINSFLDPGWIAIAHTVKVGTSGAVDFTSVKDACDWVATQSPSISNPYVIEVAAGVYTESPFTVPTYTKVFGSGQQMTQIVTNNNSAHFITPSIASWIQNCALTGPTGAGYAVVNYETNSFTPFFMKDVMIRAGFIWVHPTGGTGVGHFFGVCNWFGSVSEYFIRASDRGHVAMLHCEYMNGTAPSVVGFLASGSNAAMTADYCGYRGTGNGFKVDDGATLRMTACTIGRASNAVIVGATGSNTKLYESATSRNLVSGQITGNHLQIDTGATTPTIVILGSTLTRTAISNPDSHTIIGLCSDAQGTYVLSELEVGATQVDAVPVGAWIRDIASTGIVSGGQVTRVSGLDVQVGSGVGFINTGTGVPRITWSLVAALNLPSNSTNWIYVDSTGTVDSSITKPSEATNILLAVAVTNSTDVIALAMVPVDSGQAVRQVHEWVEESIGNMVADGVIGTVNTGLTFDVSSGEYFQSIHPHETDELIAPTFVSWYQDGLGGYIGIPGQTALDDVFYDDASGTLAAIPAGEWVAVSVWIAHSHDGTEAHVMYPTATYATEQEAREGVIPTAPDWLIYAGVISTAFIVQQSSGLITGDPIDLRPMRNAVAGGGSGGGGSAHSSLTGRSSDSGGHPIYVYLTGDEARNPLTGAIDFTNGRLIVPQDPVPSQTALGSLVLNTTSDRLCWGDGVDRVYAIDDGTAAGGDLSGFFPNPTVTDLTITSQVQGSTLYFNGTSWVQLSPGTAGKYFRTQGAAANPLWDSLAIRSTGIGTKDIVLASTEALAANRTISWTVADADRVVSLGGDLTLGGGLTTSGAFPLTLTVTGSTNVTLPTTGTLGALTSSAPSDVTKAAASVGVATDVARSDHKHDISTAVPVAVGTANSEGVSTSLSRADHVHASASSNIVQRFSATIVTSSPTTTSTTFAAAVPQCTTTFTPTSASNPLRVTFNCTFTHSNNNANIDTAVFVDGVQQSNTQRGAQVGATFPRRITYYMDTEFTLSAAAHTIEIRWRTSVGTVTAEFGSRSFTIEEIKV